MQEKLKCFFQSELSRELFSLYLVQGATSILPVLTIPYLARTLGVEGWGTLAYFQSYALYGGLLLEYGFAFSATRSLARKRSCHETRVKLLADVLGAKLLLAIAFVTITASTALILPRHRGAPLALAIATAWALGQGLNFIWYYQGIAKMRLLAVIDVSSRLLVTLLMLTTVKTPNHAERALGLYATGAVSSSLISGILCYRSSAFRIPTLTNSFRALKEGLPMFFCRSAISLYTTANGFLLGQFASMQYVAYFAGAERISKGVLVANQPLSQVMYSHINHVIKDDPNSALRVQRGNLIAMVCTGLVTGFVVLLFAPQLVSLALGPNFSRSVISLRIMALLSPLVAAATALGSHCMLPRGFDREFNVIVIAAGVLNVGLASLLGPTLHDVGMSIAVVSSEGLVAASVFLFLWLKGVNPLCTKGHERKKHSEIEAKLSDSEPVF